jgi:hypothetical protein
VRKASQGLGYGDRRTTDSGLNNYRFRVKQLQIPG